MKTHTIAFSELQARVRCRSLVIQFRRNISCIVQQPQGGFRGRSLRSPQKSVEQKETPALTLSLYLRSKPSHHLSTVSGVIWFFVIALLFQFIFLSCADDVPSSFQPHSRPAPSPRLVHVMFSAPSPAYLTRIAKVRHAPEVPSRDHPISDRKTQFQSWARTI
jgi:hypothetical protein